MKELRVHYRSRRQSLWLGTLADDDRDVLFEYSPDAIARGLELSPIRLPLRAAAYPDRQEDYVKLQRVPGLLYDSLPDSWGFLLMNRRLRAQGINPDTVSTLDRLAYLGENTMGALTYEPATEPFPATHDLALIDLAREVRAVIHDDGHAVLAELARAGGSPGGARPKALVFYDPDTGQMSTQEGRSGKMQPWLVKFPAKEDSADSCALEELYARLARRCDMGMGDTELFDMPHGMTAFGTRRFDREAGNRVHVHSLAGLLQANFQIPSVGYNEFLQLTRRLTRDEREVKNALQRCIFNILLNNRDDHAKNLAFTLGENDRWHLAPPFDLTYCPGYAGEHFMDVAGEGRYPTRSHVLSVAEKGGLKRRQAEEIIDEMLDAIPDSVFREEAARLPIQPQTVDDVAKIVEGNRARLETSRTG
jgi:serine/threonine-protein kinase HipA